jgi:CRP-like cAMP-binding protein
VPRVLRTRGELAQEPLDHREGFVLSLVDGETTVQGLIDVAGIPDGELVVTLQRLRRLGIITLG